MFGTHTGFAPTRKVLNMPNTKNAILHSSREEVTKSIFILPVLLFSIQDSHQNLHYSILTDTLIASIAIFRQSL